VREIRILTTHEKDTSKFFRWLEVEFQYERFDGSFSKPQTHMVLERGDSVAVLLHDVPNDKVVIVEQVRIATKGWLLEIPAGKIDKGEEPADTANREAEEETGIKPASVERIASFFLSPGACSEKLHLFYCPFDQPLEIQEFGGLESESEDIRLHLMTVEEAIRKIESREIADAKTILALYWLTSLQTGSPRSTP